jgi:hypothetical protein
MAMSFSLIMISVMSLGLFLATVVKPLIGESVALLFFSALFAAFSFLCYLQYVHLQCLAAKETLREYVDEVMRKTKQGA